jgi:hypothetical protein
MSNDIEVKYDKLEELPALPNGWVRLVHRCIAISLGKNKVASIKENGLIFNRNVAQISPSQRGGTYPSPGYMVSVYNEELFWQSIEKDNFIIFDDAKYADTKIIFDMPIEEYCFLEKYGRVAIGKIDKKYITGVIPNYNGHNKHITLPKEDVIKAKQKSLANKKELPTPTPIDVLIASIQQRFKTMSKEKILNSINIEKEDILYEINKQLSETTKTVAKNINLTSSNQR